MDIIGGSPPWLRWAFFFFAIDRSRLADERTSGQVGLAKGDLLLCD